MFVNCECQTKLQFHAHTCTPNLYITDLVDLIGHFAVVSSVTWPLNGSEAGVDLALIQTSLHFSRKCKLVSIRTT